MVESQSAERHPRFLRAFTTHEPVIRAYVRRLVLSRTDVDDVLQEKFDEFQTSGDFRARACGITRYKVLSRLRDLSREWIVLANDVTELIARSAQEHERHCERLLALCFRNVPPKGQELPARADDSHARLQDIATLSGRSVAGWKDNRHPLRLHVIE